MILVNERREKQQGDVADSEPSPPSRLPLSAVRVLIADDDRLPRRIAAAAIATAGATPVEAVDGPTALALWSSRAAGEPAFDAAVVDFQMPGMDGADLVRALRSLGFKGAAIGLTATATDAQVDAWIAAGCDDVLMKGASCAELVVELTAAHRRRRNRLRFRPR